MFNGEWDILELRLNTHDPVVDYYVITESIYTHTGNLKKLHLDLLDSRLQRFIGKIRYIIVTDMPNTGDPYDNDAFQRNAITRGLWDKTAEDLIIISDCDEIIKPHYITAARDHLDFDIFGFQQTLCYCFMNNIMVGEWGEKIWSVAVRGKILENTTPSWCRWNLGAAPYWWYPNAGWHYSYMMDVEEIKTKISNFSHQEFNKPELLNTLDPATLAYQGKDLLGRDWIKWNLKSLQEVDLPDYVRQNLDKYKKYLLE
jgi:beta-1,4-mannosyl-glycoprotein beta-1,4-N-acetylglucosaminyltransferase